jgi:hypothetical protein
MLRYAKEDYFDAQVWRVVAGFAFMADGLVGVLTLGLFASDLSSPALMRVMHHRLRRR